MRAQGVRADFLNALSIAGKSVKPKHNIPVLACILIESSDNTLKITGTDMVVTSVATCECATMTAGTVAVSLSEIMPIIQSSNSDGFKLELEGERLKVTCGKTQAKLATIEADTFPTMVKPPEDTELLGVSDHILFCEKFAGGSALNKAYDGVHLSPDYIASTDSKKIALVSHRTGIKHAIIPREHITIISNSLKSGGRLFLSDKTWRVEGAEYNFFGPLLDDGVIQWGSIVSPSSSGFVCEVNSFIDAIKCAPNATSCMISSQGLDVLVTLDGNNGFTAKQPISGEAFQEFSICVSTSSIKPILEALKGSTVSFNFGDKQIFIKPLGRDEVTLVTTPRRDARNQWNSTAEAAA